MSTLPSSAWSGKGSSSITPGSSQRRVLVLALLVLHGQGRVLVLALLVLHGQRRVLVLALLVLVREGF